MPPNDSQQRHELILKALDGIEQDLKKLNKIESELQQVLQRLNIVEIFANKDEIQSIQADLWELKRFKQEYEKQAEKSDTQGFTYKSSIVTTLIAVILTGVFTFAGSYALYTMQKKESKQNTKELIEQIIQDKKEDGEI